MLKVRNAMRAGLRGAAVAGIGATLFLGAIWSYNLLTAIPRWRRWSQADERGPDHELASSPGFFDDALSHSVYRWLASLDEALFGLLSVDLSTVTTLVLFITAACATSACWRLSSGEKSRWTGGESFPFWAGFQSSFVQLGLLGTIFGFIVAFHSNRAELEGYDPMIIYSALGTSLYSTFFATVLAYVVAPAFLMPAFRMLRDRVLEPREHGQQGGLAGAMAQLSERVVEADGALAQLSDQAASACEALARLEERKEEEDLKAMRCAVDSLRVELENLRVAWNAYREDSHSRLLELHRMQKQGETAHLATMHRLDELEESVRELQDLAVDRHKLATIQTLIGELVRPNGSGRA
jgi:hypothetical protein